MSKQPSRIGINLAPLAAKAGLPLAEVLALPDEPPVIHRDSALRRCLAVACVPTRYAGIFLDARLEETEPVRDVRAWLQTASWALVLGGEKGTGKTVAACAGLVEAGGGLFVTTEEIASPDGRGVLESAMEAPFLVLDEMGEEGLSDFGASRLRRLLGSRHANARRTACTTNLNLRGAGGWEERYGSRLVDRLREDGGRFIGYAGPSLRSSR